MKLQIKKYDKAETIINFFLGVFFLKRISLVILYLVIISIGIANKEIFIQWIKKGDTSDLPMMILFSIVFGIIPIFPFSVFAGLMGIKYGIVLGMFITWLGLLVAAIAYFLFARHYMGHVFLTKVSRFEKIEQLLFHFKDNLVALILILRLFPIVPHQIVGIYAGISSISFIRYTLITAIGLLFPMFLVAFASNQPISNLPYLILILSLFTGTLLIGFFILRTRIKNKRAMS